MTQTHASGWIVQVTPALATPVTDPPPFKCYNAAIADVAKAVEAVKKLRWTSRDIRIEAIRSLSSLQIAAVQLESGDIKPA